MEKKTENLNCVPLMFFNPNIAPDGFWSPDVQKRGEELLKKAIKEWERQDISALLNEGLDCKSES